MPQHVIHRGPQGGRYQVSHKKDRYLLDKKVQTGPSGGKYQRYGRKGKEKRYLLA